MMGEDVIDPVVLGAGDEECVDEASELPMLHSSESRRESSAEESLRIIGWGAEAGVEGGVRLRLLAECRRDFRRSLFLPPSNSM
jgi:hypothetical protein